MGEESYKDSTLIMQLLRDNLTLWTSDITVSLSLSPETFEAYLPSCFWSSQRTSYSASCYVLCFRHLVSVLCLVCEIPLGPNISIASLSEASNETSYMITLVSLDGGYELNVKIANFSSTNSIFCSRFY